MNKGMEGVLVELNAFSAKKNFWENYAMVCLALHYVEDIVT